MSDLRTGLKLSDYERAVVLDSVLFSGASPDELDHSLECLRAVKKTFMRGEMVLRSGDMPRYVGVILSGRVTIDRVDPSGNTSITAGFGLKDVFGEALAYSNETTSPVTVTATEDTTILLLPNERLVSTCSTPCALHPRLTENVVRLIAKRNVHLNRKIDYLSLRSTREKLVAYLQEQRWRNESSHFTLPLTKSELASYLCVDRSAMSRELSGLRDEGYIDFHRNSFTILKELP